MRRLFVFPSFAELLIEYWQIQFGEDVVALKKILVFALFFVLLSVQAAFAANVNIITSDGITNRDIENTVKAINMTGRYMDANFQRRLRTDVTLNLVTADSKIASDESGSFSTNGKITITIKDSSSDYRTVFLVAHELVHQYQQDIAPPSTLNKNMWMTEGMADYIAMKTANQLGKDRTQAFWKYAKTSREYPIGLSSVSSRRDWNENSQTWNLYPLADRAVFCLATKYPEQMLFAYILALNTHTAEEAMRLTYGIGMGEILEKPAKGKG